MLLYPNHIEAKLGFDKIRSLVKDSCSCTLGKARVQEMKIHDHYATIVELLDQTEEQKHQLASGDPFPEIKGYSLFPQLDRSHVVGYHLEAETLFQLKFNLEIALNCSLYFLKHSETYPVWASLAEGILVPKELLKALNGVFDIKGSVKDSATPELKRIRQGIRQNEDRVKKDLESILRKARSEGYTEKDSTLTIRDGRLVIPLFAEHKRRIKGLVVDESATGKTVYLEPLEIFNLNNQIRELHFAEKREIISILTALTASLVPYKKELKEIEAFLADLDLTRAKAKVARRFNAIRPQVENQRCIDLRIARHPLLELAHLKMDLPVVPLNIRLDANQHIIIISGPNAGGKSVCLKTVGLLQIMLQAGMLVPVGEDSVMGVFHKVFIDIGDEQSIESDLSTYSSHLTNMNYFLRNCDGSSLFLIDEFGTGTEPQFGGAIAESILSQLASNQAFGIITTHYGNLKKFAETHPHLQNAAMRFDRKKLVPLYSLEIGRPGSSFALEIAGKIGLPEAILLQARSMIGKDPIAFETLVSQLEEEKLKYDLGQKKLQQLIKELDEQKSKYYQLTTDLEARKKQMMDEAKQAAQNLLSEANQKIETTIRTIKESNANKSVTKAVRKDLERFQERVKPEAPQKLVVAKGPIKVGDLVRVVESKAQGEVLKITGKSALIRLGSLKSKIKLERLQKIGEAQPKPKPEPSQASRGLDLYQRRAQYSTQLDVRGMRAGEALKAVTQFIDNGMLLGISDLRIVHGKGDGILREIIRKYLQEEPGVESVQEEHAERGGSGVTLVVLK